MTFNSKGEALPEKLNKYVHFYEEGGKHAQKCDTLSWTRCQILQLLLSPFSVVALADFLGPFGYAGTSGLALIPSLPLHCLLLSASLLSVWIFQVALKKEVLEEVPDCSRGRDALHAEQRKADDTHRYTPALIWQGAAWGEVAINLHILSNPIASASTGGGKATPANFFYNMDIVR